MEKVNYERPEKSGVKEEDRFQYMLEEANLEFVRNRSKGIDFIVENRFYVDVKKIKDRNEKGEKVGGTVDEKLPHTVYKYYDKYKVKNKSKTYYIALDYPLGRNPREEGIIKHIEFLEEVCNINVIIGTLNETMNLILSENLSPPRKYEFGKFK